MVWVMTRVCPRPTLQDGWLRSVLSPGGGGSGAGRTKSPLIKEKRPNSVSASLRRRSPRKVPLLRRVASSGAGVEVCAGGVVRGGGELLGRGLPTRSESAGGVKRFGKRTRTER